jgi:hypothetical protein
MDEKATTTAALLRRGVGFHRRHGIGVEAVLTDNERRWLSLGAPFALLQDARDQARADAALLAAEQRQGVCLSVAVPSGWATRLLAAGGLTQAKACWDARAAPIGPALACP